MFKLWQNAVRLQKQNSVLSHVSHGMLQATQNTSSAQNRHGILKTLFQSQ